MLQSYFQEILKLKIENKVNLKMFWILRIFLGMSKVTKMSIPCSKKEGNEYFKLNITDILYWS